MSEESIKSIRNVKDLVSDLIDLFDSADRVCIILEKGDDRQLINLAIRREDDHV